MRCIHVYLLAVLSVAALTGCKKESPTTQNNGGTNPPAPNTAPRVNAGPDIWIVVPANTCIVKGWAADAENNIEKFLWQQVFGPGTPAIENPAFPETKVTGLQKGTYRFTLTITDKGGLSNSDTVSVFVHDPAPAGSGEVIFNDLPWTCPMGCSLLINCLTCYVPAQQPFRVFLRKDSADQWVEVVPEDRWTANDRYIYGVDKDHNTLWIYAGDEEGTPDVKITY